jgi:nucleoid-associated protein YgaU
MSATAGSSTETTTDVAAAPREDQMQAPADESAAADQSVAAQVEAESDMAASAQPETADAGATAVGQSAETAQPSVGTEQMAGAAPSSAASSTKEMAAAPASPGDSAAEKTTAAAEPSQPSTPEKTETPPADAAPPPAMSEVTEAPATPEVAEPPPVTPEVGVAAVEAETDGTLYIAGTATTREPVRVYIDEVLVGETTPTEGGTWLLETEREMPPAEYTIRADQIEAGSGDVVARAEVPFRREIEVASLSVAGESTGSGTAEVAGRISDPAKVVIKRGDNLWRISRSLYGRGIRYSTIYKANQDQIRDPDLIYPGQVFVMPTGDTAWDSQQ